MQRDELCCINCVGFKGSEVWEYRLVGVRAVDFRFFELSVPGFGFRVVKDIRVVNSSA